MRRPHRAMPTVTPSTRSALRAPASSGRYRPTWAP
jgi:hypothetical protein